MSTPGQAVRTSPRRARRFNRYRFDTRIQLTVFREGHIDCLWGRTNEIGQDGIGATVSGELKPDEVVSLDFPIPIAPHLLKVRAVVRYSDGLRCGFEFLVVNDQQRELLRQLGVLLSNAS